MMRFKFGSATRPVVIVNGLLVLALVAPGFSNAAEIMTAEFTRSRAAESDVWGDVDSSLRDRAFVASGHTHATESVVFPAIYRRYEGFYEPRKSIKVPVPVTPVGYGFPYAYPYGYGYSYAGRYGYGYGYYARPWYYPRAALNYYSYRPWYSLYYRPWYTWNYNPYYRYQTYFRPRLGYYPPLPIESYVAPPVDYRGCYYW